ncbi:MAG: CCDC90 family protein [Zoogloeaceae bacterium]|jgi:chromosome segregation ATPase|nr:CCDC90 family protein [Zoogloeaceae bacterium]
MSNVVAFDTHKFFKKLEASGFERSNAEGLTEAIQDAITTADLATKHDLKNTENTLKAEIGEVRSELEKVRGELKADISEVRAELKADISEVRGELEKVRGELKTEIAQTEAHIIRWIVSAIIGTGAIAAAIGAIIAQLLK